MIGSGPQEAKLSLFPPKGIRHRVDLRKPLLPNGICWKWCFTDLLL
jgi:hypothetical protein